jgi:hypothetical protein
VKGRVRLSGLGFCVAGPTGIEPVTPGFLRELLHLRVRCSSLTELRARVCCGKEPQVRKYLELSVSFWSDRYSSGLFTFT